MSIYKMFRSNIFRIEVKNIGCLMNAMLKKHNAHVSVLSRSLEEGITPKKAWERMNGNLHKMGDGQKKFTFLTKQIFLYIF